MKKELSSDAQNYLSWINEDTIIDPDNWRFRMKGGSSSFIANSQLTRSLVRAPLVEINEYKPNILPDQIKRDFNLIRIANRDDLIPTEMELKRFKDKLQSLVVDSQVKFWIKCLKEDPHYKIENTIISAWMIDISDVMDFMDGVDLQIIYRNVADRKRKFDALPSGITNR